MIISGNPNLNRNKIRARSEVALKSQTAINSV